MEYTCKVLIVTDEPIFYFGLQVQFHGWGFAWVEGVENCQLALFSIDKVVPTLLIVDEKFLQGQEWGRSLLLLIELKAIPMIILSVASYPAGYSGTHTKKHYAYLNKPCQIVDLQLAVECLLNINALETS